MANELKITFTGGSLLGEERTLVLDSPVLIGRSHSVDVRLKEADVSGRHIELTWVNGGVNAKCLSRHGFQWNGMDIAEGESQGLYPRDVVSIGSRVRFRVDGVASGVESAEAEGSTFATRAITSEGTVATQFMSSAGETFATRIGEVTLPSDIESAPHGSMKESPVTETDSLMAVPRVTDIPRTRTARPAAVPVDDTPTADEPADPLPPPPQQPDEAADFNIPQDDVPTGTDTSLSGDGGETVEMKTRQGSMDEIFRMKRLLEMKKRFRRRLIGFSFLAFMAILGTIVFVRWPRSEKFLSNPKVPGTDEPDFASYEVKSRSGGTDMEVKYPKCAQMNVSKTDSGLEVSTFTGRDRDVPFRLSFVRQGDARQLHWSLEEAVAKECESLAQKGYIFFRADDDDDVMSESQHGFSFYEAKYKGWCEPRWIRNGSKRGMRFFQREYVRTEGSVKWHGIMMMFRNGRLVFRLMREIPDAYWAKGKYLMRDTPYLALYWGFLNRHWESPGDRALLQVESSANLDALFVRAQKLLAKDWPEDWPDIEKIVNTLVVRTYEGSEDARKRAATLLQNFRKAKDIKYVAFKNDYDRKRDSKGSKAKTPKDLEDVRAKCRGAFGWDANDWRSVIINDPKEW